MIAFGNAIPTDKGNPFFQRLMEGIAKEIKFQVAQIVSPQEFDHFCTRFWGAKSVAFEHNLGNDKPLWQGHKPIMLTGKNIPRALHGLAGINITHQFYAQNQ